MAIQKKNGNGNWLYTKDTAVTGPADAKTTTKILRTKDTFVDADIEIVVNEAAVAEGKLKSVTGNAPVAKVGLNDETYLTTNATGNYGPITATADAASTSKSGVGAVQTSGWINNDATLTVSTPAAAQDSITKYIKAGNLEATVVGDAPVATVGLTDTTYLTTTSTGNFGPITATADAQATSKTGVDAVATAGWIPNDATVTITTPAATRASTTKYVKAGALADATGGEVLATAGFTSASNEYLTDTDTGYAVEATSNAERTAVEVKVKTAGWIPDTASQTSAGMVAEEVKAKKYVKKGELQAGNGSVSATGTGVALGTASTTAPTNGKYISVSGSGSASVKTAGWVADDASLNSKTATKYYSVPGATLSNTEKSGSTYTEITSKDNANVIIPSDGYLYINSGYIDDTKISLATLVPDDATISETATGKSDKMRGISAYDKNGKLIAGSMPDATLATSGTASGTATISTPSYNSTSGKFDQTASGSITGTASASTTSTGYATKDSTSATGSVTGSISGSKSLDKITVKATKGTDGKVTPKIKNNTASVTDKTQITSAPSTASTDIDKYYIAVSTDAIDASTTVTPGVSTAGYGDTTNYASAGNVTVTRGAASSGTYYIPVKSGSHDVTKATDGAVKPVIKVDTTNNNASVGTLTTTKPGSGNYVAVNTSAITASTDVACKTTEGWVETETDGKKVTVTRGASAADTAYIPVTTATYTAGTATISGPTYNTSTEKFDISSSGNATVNQQGHTGAKGTSTGAVSGSKELNKIAGSVSINGTKTVKPAISKASWTPATNVTDAATSDAATTTAPTSGVYVAVNTAAKTTNVTASATVSTEGYGTASQHGISSSGNVAVGASVADTTYVKIKEGGLSGANGGAVTATAGLADTTYLTTTATGNYGPITATADASAANSSIKVTTEGWLKKDTSATVTGQTATQDSVTKYVKAGSLSNATGGAVTATAGLADTTYLTTDSTAGYGPITATADASRTAVTVKVGTAGWIPTTASKTSAATDATQDSVTKYVKKGALKSVAGNAPVATAGFSSSSYLTDTETSYPVTATANAAATSKSSVGAVNTAGWVPSNATVTVTTPKATQATATKYIKAGSLSTSNFKDKTTTGTDLANYTENTSVAVPSGGSLVIEEGYYPKTFITLDQILDGKADTAGTAAGDVKSGYIAYNVDGQKLTGTLAKLTSSNFTRSSTTLGGSTSATISGPTYNETSGKFDVSSSGSASKSISVTAGKEGWVANGDTVYSGSISSGTISGSKALNKIEIQATKGTDGTVTPVISNIAAATTGNTQVTISPSKTAPTASSDTRYVAVRTAAISGSTTVTPSVKTAGYGDTTNYTSAGNVTVTRGSAASGTYYADLGKPTLTASGSISAVTVGTKSGSTYPITVKTGSASAGISKAGYALTSDSVTGTITSTATIPAGGCSCTKGTDGTVKPVIKVDTTNNNASVGTLTTTKPSSGNYIAVNTSAISASTDINCAHTEGWIPAMDATKQLTVTRGASAATTAYIPITAGGHSVAAGTNDIKKATATATTTIKNKAGTAISVLTSAPSSGDYIVIGGSATTAAGTLSNTVTCTSTAGYVAAGSKTATVSGSVGVTVTNASNKYIKIYDGALVT